MEKDLTFDGLPDGCALARVDRWYLRKTPMGFNRLRAARVERFCYGRARLVPDTDGFVRIALLQSHWSAEESHRVARFKGALRLRADGEGTIAPIHRADAFALGEPGAVLKQFEQRRNAGVEWKLDEHEWQELNDFVQRKIGTQITEGDD
jgi:hypothetical protein